MHEIKAPEQVQMRATKITPSLRNKLYHERLRFLNLSTLKFCRNMGDMRLTYKILNGMLIRLQQILLFHCSLIPEVTKVCG